MSARPASRYRDRSSPRTSAEAGTRRARPKGPGLLLATLVVGAGGCSFAPEPEPVAPVGQMPGAFVQSGAPGAYEPLRWWTAFQDPTLERLIDTALVANLDLAEAVTRVREARAQLGIATAELLPSVDASGNASRQNSPRNAGFGAQLQELLGGLEGDTTGMGGDGDGGDGDGAPEEEPSDRFVNTDYSASLGLSYELDFWGRARNDRGAAVADLLASEADLHTARLGVLAETITAYFDLVDVRRRLDLTDEIVGVLAEREALTEDRYDRGLVTSFELYQIRQELRNAQASLPRLRTEHADVRRRLALLTGRHLDELDPLLDEADAPVLPDRPVPAGVPADLLWQRPDVRAAGLRLRATRLRVGARRAELLPRLTLSGSLGLQSSEPGGIADLSQWFGNLAAGLAAPLFQGGRLRAGVDAAEARHARQLAVYGRTVLTAVGEAEVALLRYREERDRLAFLRAQLQEAESSVELQAQRYAAGVAPYPDFLDALRNRLTVATTLTAAARQVALARLGVHRALGGSWTAEVEPPPARDGASAPPFPTDRENDR